MNQNNISNNNCSSCFIDYVDYTTTSLNNYNSLFKIIFVSNIIQVMDQDIPNNITLQAISEARNLILLNDHNNIDDFFDALEK